MTSRPLIALLGAGESRRFGTEDKLSMPCGGKPLGRWAVDAALACPAQLVWIYGKDMPDFLPPDLEAVPNPQWASGMGSSIAVAAQEAKARHASALLLLPADMPFVTSELLSQLLACRGTAACTYPDGRAGVPARFGVSQYSALAAYAGASGAGEVLRAAQDLQCLTVPARTLFDVDTPEDLVRAAHWCQTLGRDVLGPGVGAEPGL
jgi:molybdenum cofactor cytidylyltransferase